MNTLFSKLQTVAANVRHLASADSSRTINIYKVLTSQFQELATLCRDKAKQLEDEQKLQNGWVSAEDVINDMMKYTGINSTNGSVALLKAIASLVNRKQLLCMNDGAQYVNKRKLTDAVERFISTSTIGHNHQFVQNQGVCVYLHNMSPRVLKFVKYANTQRQIFNGDLI